LNMALMNFTRLALERRMEERGRAEAGRWLAERQDSAVSITALLRTAFRLMFFAIVLIDIVGLDESARMTLADVAVAGGISAVVLWLITSVMGNALARYAATGLIVR